MLPLVILAGYSPKPKLFGYFNTLYSAVFNRELYIWNTDKNAVELTKQGQTKKALDWLLDSISDAKSILKPIIVVTGLERQSKDEIAYIQQGNSFAENMVRGYEVAADKFQLDKKDYVLFMTSDIITVNSENLDELVEDLEPSLNDMNPLVISYIKKETLKGFKRRFVWFYDDYFTEDGHFYKAKESNILAANGYADMLKLDRLYSIRKLLNPHNWIKAFGTSAHATGLSNSIETVLMLFNDFLTKRGISTKRAVSILEALLEQSLSFYEIKSPAFSKDVDSWQDIKRLGFTLPKRQSH